MQRDEVDEDILQMQRYVPFHLDEDKFQHNLRTSRRGAAGGPSGMTAEHLRVLLDSSSCTSLLGEAASQLAQGNIPEEVVTAIRLGRMTALQKPTEEFEALSVVMSSGALSQGPSPNKMRNWVKQQHIFSNTFCPQGLEQSA